MLDRRNFLKTLAAGSVAFGKRADTPVPIRSARSGLWSSAGTWEGGHVPAAGSVVEIVAGHAVTYDVESDFVIRMVHVLGTLSFARHRNTRLDVGLLKIAGDASEDGAGLSPHFHFAARPALEIGTPGPSHSRCAYGAGTAGLLRRIR